MRNHKAIRANSFKHSDPCHVRAAARWREGFLDLLAGRPIDVKAFDAMPRGAQYDYEQGRLMACEARRRGLPLRWPESVVLPKALRPLIYRGAC